MAPVIVVFLALEWIANQGSAVGPHLMMAKAKISLQSGRRQTLKASLHLIALLTGPSPRQPVQVDPNLQAVQEDLRLPLVLPHHPFPKSPFRFLREP